MKNVDDRLNSQQLLINTTQTQRTEVLVEEKVYKRLKLEGGESRIGEWQQIDNCVEYSD